MALIVGNTPGTDLAFSEEKVKGYRNFANKIWQATRFVLTNLAEQRGTDAEQRGKIPRKSALSLRESAPLLIQSDKQRIKEFEAIKKKITKQMDSFKFYIAAEEIYHYFWHIFCDKIIEEMKSRLKNDNQNERAAAQYVLLELLKGSLKLLHPFMPFITEEIWQSLADNKNRMLIVEKW
jgi:valyl-tRNA synthetase